MTILKCNKVLTLGISPTVMMVVVQTLALSVHAYISKMSVYE